jgi:hypothetical protein
VRTSSAKGVLSDRMDSIGRLTRNPTNQVLMRMKFIGEKALQADYSSGQAREWLRQCLVMARAIIEKLGADLNDGLTHRLERIVNLRTSSPKQVLGHELNQHV